MANQKGYHTHLALVIFFLCQFIVAQTSEQKALEEKRARIQNEIKEINRLLFAEKQEKGNVLEQMDALDYKINISQELIRVTNQQSNLLNRQINANIRAIDKMREDLKFLKDDYAQLIRKSYENKAQENRLLFLLSSQNFFQAFKRIQYLKQYKEFRRKQGQEIVDKTEALTKLNKELVEQRKAKDQLIAENTKIKNQLSREINNQKELLQSIRQNESKYRVAIDDRKKETRRIDREIEKLIRSAITSSNKKAGKSNSTKFELTPEAELIASNFSSNKGKLIWPVQKGIKSQGFGVYADKVYPSIKHENSGVTITTDQGETARAIFEGEVITIFTNKMGVMGVYLRHGNYISMYYNLSKTFVQKGDKVSAKDPLGEIYTNRFKGATELKFYLYQDTNKLNPEDWIYQL
ncbi:MAG: peptidoglycan DD-metalloendopeptidase family protein [Croceitalea sp.]|nr:peptidoglycan DD-metalloendopeptidase family protein [Croceitalea sp.]